MNGSQCRAYTVPSDPRVVPLLQRHHSRGARAAGGLQARLQQGLVGPQRAEMQTLLAAVPQGQVARHVAAVPLARRVRRRGRARGQPARLPRPRRRRKGPGVFPLHVERYDLLRCRASIDVQGDPAERYGISVKRELSSTSSDASFATAEEWLETCKANHICAKRLPLKDHDPDFQTWPARLVDLEAFPAPSQDVRLVAQRGPVDRYVTLSYCWGRTRTLATTSRCLRLRERRIPFAHLPRTFRDAACVARRLGVRWLWIDALCIVQDDPADWERESVKMGAIYSLAYVTVAADAGVDCESGCFNEASTSQDRAFDAPPLALRVPVGATVEAGASGGDELATIHLWDPSARQRRPTPPEIDASPLATRGWVCQERILSPRILHYTHAQLFWECREAMLAEDNLRPWAVRAPAAAPLGPLLRGRGGRAGALARRVDRHPRQLGRRAERPERRLAPRRRRGGEEPATACGLARSLYGTTSDATGRARLLRVWYAAVVARAYSRRRLTLPGDKLPALSGLARAFARHLRVRYLAGLWHLRLAWGARVAARPRRRAGGGRRGERVPAAAGERAAAGPRPRGKASAGAAARPAAAARTAPRASRGPRATAPSSGRRGRRAAPCARASATPTSPPTGAGAAWPLAGADPFGRAAAGCALTLRGFVLRGAVAVARRRLLRASSGAGAAAAAAPGPPPAGERAGAGAPAKSAAEGGGAAGGPGVEWAWELRGARGQWLGTAFLDDDPDEDGGGGEARRATSTASCSGATSARATRTRCCSSAPRRRRRAPATATARPRSGSRSCGGAAWRRCWGSRTRRTCLTRSTSLR